MKKLSILGLSAGAALFCAIPVSLQVSEGKLSASLDSANARVGRPLTPGSIAGVNRRVNRRAARGAYYGGAGYYGDAGYYGGAGLAGAAAAGMAAGAAAASTPFDNGNWGSWNGAGPGYGAPVVGPRARAARAAADYASGGYPVGTYANTSSPSPYASYPTRATAAGFPPSYYGPVCNPRVDKGCY